jgi:hypothetical protein
MFVCQMSGSKMFFGQRIRSHIYLIPGGAGLPVAVVVPVDAVDPGGVVGVHRVVGVLVRLLKHKNKSMISHIRPCGGQ